MRKYFPIKVGIFAKKYIRAVDDVSFTVNEGEALGLVGESGSGKSTIAKLIMGLMKPNGGTVRFMNYDMFKLSKKELRKVRQKMGMIFQNPSSALNPKMTIAEIVSEPLKLQNLEKREMFRKAREILDLVALPPSYLDRYPHELSGGEKQRVTIARALITSPKLVIADEPTSSLDVSTQAQILELIKNLKTQLNLTLIFISHDLAVVKYICDKVVVLYMGKVMEMGSKRDIFVDPLHPYTRALHSAILEPGFVPKERVVLKDVSSAAMNHIKGCVVSTRCPFARELCKMKAPDLVEARPGHFVACHFL
ncbi:MAG: ABC transporter ATP-binding protein [Desulfurococcaceae archaeon]